MNRRRTLLPVLAMLGLAVAGRAADQADGWERIRTGMTRGEMVAALGEPLLGSRGRQFELCIYDEGAEVVCFRDTVVAWTAPSGSPSRERRDRLGAQASGDPGEENVAGRQIDLSRVARPPPVVAPVAPVRKVYVPRGELDAGYDRIPARHARLPRL